MAMDLFTFGIPFFFMLAIVFGALEVGGVFKNKGVKIIISLVIAAFAATNEQAVQFIFYVLPYATIFFVVVFFLGFIVKSRKEGDKDWFLMAIVLILFLLLLMNFESLTGIAGDLGTTIATVLGVIIVLMVFYAAYQQTRGGGKS